MSLDSCSVGRLNSTAEVYVTLMMIRVEVVAGYGVEVVAALEVVAVAAVAVVYIQVAAVVVEACQSILLADGPVDDGDAAVCCVGIGSTLGESISPDGCSSSRSTSSI